MPSRPARALAALALLAPALGALGPAAAQVAAAGFPLVPVTGQARPCTSGQATFASGGTTYAFPCSGVDLMSFLPLASIGGATNSGATSAATIATTWGWTDPQTGREYALLGRSDGTAFVDVTDPVNPVYVGLLPRPAFRADNPATPVLSSSWREFKVLGNTLAVVSEAGGHGLQTFDLTGLRAFAGTPLTFAQTGRYAGHGRAHNVLVSEVSNTAISTGLSTSGDATVRPSPSCGQGLHFVDLTNPAAPTWAGCYNARSVNGSRGYTHDAQCVRYHGPDARYTNREVCLLSDEKAVIIVDATNKAAVAELGVGTYPNVGYTHQGWLSEDHRHFFVDDELDEDGTGLTRTLVFDVADLTAPVLVAEYRGTTTAVDHNQYVRGRYLYQANYTAGVRILDTASPAALREVAYFDAYPASNARQFSGIWNVYPYFRSGIVVAGGMNEGLFVLRPRLGSLNPTEEPPVPGAFALVLGGPNPFRAGTEAVLTLGTAGPARVALYDALGRAVAVLHDGPLAAGTHRLAVDGSGLPTGAYTLRARAGAAERTLGLVRVR